MTFIGLEGMGTNVWGCETSSCTTLLA